MSFSKLPKEIKVKIFDLLSIGSRYNASLVWEDMADYTWRSILEYKESLIPLSGHCQQINKLHDLEVFGVLAYADHLEWNIAHVELFGFFIIEFTIKDIDISTVPKNIVKSLLAELDSENLILENVTGFCYTYLESMNCENLSLISMPISSTIVNQDVHFHGHRLKLKGIIGGDLAGFLNRIYCRCLEIENMSLVRYETRVLASMLKGRRVCKLEFVDSGVVLRT